ncbi:hypothetical protein Amet_4373 [Alkaliphilus metalliredigens QYMF]|uniref:Mor transcription activator domain-containing protein n=1 Tax=Alkaliphilus metalliredigens (strain QYMF) TaxID=293826 RepID=A6TKB9_ALKMQ|nr:Mor transcription activator family protein [Alkaliphilus metalliredigens]ABR46637.1 hypothetical protein Amet_0409 [Alkaliphilus metalliredigens QYMF]ABR48109.1 hypothetical protein Amet_1946 [Alkaliphilus metalliredigens QYMF]ABR50447.1 hypothetical protein Amet_4373 [Alkaliphilus metalliredigens QYMF]
MENWLEKITIDDLDEPYYTIATKIGFEATLELAKMVQGSQIYFPTIVKSCDPKRKELIKEEFNGYNYRELAAKYGFTERWVREICSELVKKERNKPHHSQLSLF